MKKQKIGWILALSMIFTQNVSVWAKSDTSADLSEKLIYAEKFALNDKISFESDVIDENTEEAEMVNNSANKTLLLEKTNPAVPVKKSDAELKTIHLNDDYSTRQKIDLTAKDTFLKIDKEIPAGKILIVSFVPDNNQYASAVIDVMNLYTHNYEYVGIPQGGWYDNSRMSYFKIRNTDMYNIEIKRIVENPISGTLRIYVADYITEQEEFEHFDSLEQKKETPDSYVVFNAPEHLHSENQLGDNYRYTGKIPVSGNANIYWEHFNEYKKDMRYGVLLHNPANRTVTVTINKKSAYYQGMNTAEQVLLNIWNDYSQNKITADETGITEFNKVLTIAPNSSAWIYLDTIESMNQANTLFNGIINLSVAQDATLYSYAFIMNIGQEVIDRIQQDFNVCGTSGIFNDWYIWAEREYEVKA